MAKTIRDLLKGVVLAVLPDSDKLRHVAYRPKLDTWRKERAGTYPVFETRTDLYDFVNNELLKNVAMQYLEFGVFEGASIKYFSEINQQAESTFVGFDSFEGLPEDWNFFSSTQKRETFSTGGKLPNISDERVSFRKGLFQQTLPGFLNEFSLQHRLVIHNDSDLYSATLYALLTANEIIKPGTIIIFDEFSCIMHEFRALEDYCSACMRSYEVVAATKEDEQIAIRML